MEDLDTVLTAEMTALIFIASGSFHVAISLPSKTTNNTIVAKTDATLTATVKYSGIQVSSISFQRMRRTSRGRTAGIRILPTANKERNKAQEWAGSC